MVRHGARQCSGAVQLSVVCSHTQQILDVRTGKVEANFQVHKGLVTCLTPVTVTVGKKEKAFVWSGGNHICANC